MASHTGSLIRYNNRAGYAGKLLGELTVLGKGQIIKVWDDALHEECRRLARFPMCTVICDYRTSEKWGNTLTAIRSEKPDYELQADARLADEARGQHHKRGSYTSDRFKKSVQAHVEAERGPR